MSLVQALGMDASCIPRIATGFGGGMGGTGDVCGALTGAVMALGLRYGRQSSGDTAAKEATYSKASRAMKAFRQEFDSIRCRDLIGCDLQTPEGGERFKKENVHANLCAKFVDFAAGEAFRLMSENRTVDHRR